MDKKILQTIACQQIRQSIINEQIPRNINIIKPE